jgi:hypothetical protein
LESCERVNSEPEDDGPSSNINNLTKSSIKSLKIVNNSARKKKRNSLSLQSDKAPTYIFANEINIRVVQNKDTPKFRRLKLQTDDLSSEEDS